VFDNPVILKNFHSLSRVPGFRGRIRALPQKNEKHCATPPKRFVVQALACPAARYEFKLTRTG
jgi:hypothetical protein